MSYDWVNISSSRYLRKIHTLHLIAWLSCWWFCLWLAGTHSLFALERVDTDRRHDSQTIWLRGHRVNSIDFDCCDWCNRCWRIFSVELQWRCRRWRTIKRIRGLCTTRRIRMECRGTVYWLVWCNAHGKRYVLAPFAMQRNHCNSKWNEIISEFQERVKRKLLVNICDRHISISMLCTHHCSHVPSERPNWFWTKCRACTMTPFDTVGCWTNDIMAHWPVKEKKMNRKERKIGTLDHCRCLPIIHIMMSSTRIRDTRIFHRKIAFHTRKHLPTHNYDSFAFGWPRSHRKCKAANVSLSLPIIICCWA